MLELFRSRLEAVDASLWVVDDAQALPGLVRERVGSGSVAAWEEALSYVPNPPQVGNSPTSSGFGGAAAVSADVSLIVADVGIAETGQVGFAHNDRRPREVALLPNRQIALLERRSLVLDARTALQKLRGPSVVLIAGPSRTADIEQRMMLGVHAPRSLDVIVFG